MVTAYVMRTRIVGGGTAYDVEIPCTFKPSRPLHGFTYATVRTHYGSNAIDSNTEFYSVRDAISRKEYWDHEPGMDKHKMGNKLTKVADRLAYRIAVRAFPELKELGKLPALWASWDKESKVVQVQVNMDLPE